MITLINKAKKIVKKLNFDLNFLSKFRGGMMQNKDIDDIHKGEENEYVVTITFGERVENHTGNQMLGE
jgi:hypothetical protein